jgi:hypothetical protein
VIRVLKSLNCNKILKRGDKMAEEGKKIIEGCKMIEEEYKKFDT